MQQCIFLLVSLQNSTIIERQQSNKNSDLLFSRKRTMIEIASPLLCRGSSGARRELVVLQDSNTHHTHTQQQHQQPSTTSKLSSLSQLSQLSVSSPPLSLSCTSNLHIRIVDNVNRGTGHNHRWQVQTWEKDWRRLLWRDLSWYVSHQSFASSPRSLPQMRESLSIYSIHATQHTES